MSCRYGLMSRETSFVAVERRETPVLGDMQLRRMPIALDHRMGRYGASEPIGDAGDCGFRLRHEELVDVRHWELVGGRSAVDASVGSSQ